MQWSNMAASGAADESSNLSRATKACQQVYNLFSVPKCHETADVELLSVEIQLESSPLFMFGEQIQ